MPLTEESRDAIENQLGLLAYALDLGRDDDIKDGKLFTDDATVRAPRGEILSAPEILSGLRRALPAGTSSRHAISNVLVSGDAGRAEATAYVIQFLTWLVPRPPHPGPTTDLVYVGQYTANLVSDGASWLIERLEIDFDSLR